MRSRSTLVVVATGIGLLVPGIPSIAIIGVFVVAVALSAWKSGWRVRSRRWCCRPVCCFTLQDSVPRDEIGWLLAAGVVVSIPLAALHGSRVHRRLSREAHALLLPEPVIAGPRSIEERLPRP